MRVYTVEQGGRKREGGVKRGKRNNSKQTQRGKDRVREALQDKQLFYFGGERGGLLRGSNDSKHGGRVRKWTERKEAPMKSQSASKPGRGASKPAGLLGESAGVLLH